MKTMTYNQDISKFGFFRLSKSKMAVDVCPNTLRAYHSQGLPLYKVGKSVFVSYAEVESFIRQHNELATVRIGPLGQTEGVSTVLTSKTTPTDHVAHAMGSSCGSVG